MFCVRFFLKPASYNACVIRNVFADYNGGLSLAFTHTNVDKRNGKNSERRKLCLKKKNSSALFPLTGNCVFDLSHHTHLVIACEVSLPPTAERRKFATAALALTLARTLKTLKDAK